VTVSVVDGPIWVADSQVSGVTATVCIVIVGTVEGELGRLMNQRPGPGISTNVVGFPEGGAEIDNSEFLGI